MKKFQRRPDCGRSVLLLEPDYPNKYPPVGLMKLATYHRLQGWRVVFFKGDLSRFVAERLTYRAIDELSQRVPDVNWGGWFGVFADYVWKGRDAGLKEGILTWGDALSDVLSTLKTYRSKYRNDEYFSLGEWDRVLVTTLFTFYAEVTIETIKFAQRLCPKEIQVGGVMASVVPEYIRQSTGIVPSTGVLAVRQIFGDKPISEVIDNLPLDYSILEEIDYKYPAEDAFFGHTTRGCVNKCDFCAVPIIEPEYQSYRPLKAKLEYERRMFGERPNLMLMDNNVFASEHFPEIVEEIKSVGFGEGAKITRSDPLQICADRVRESYNPRAYVKKGCGILRDWIKHLDQRKDAETIGIIIDGGVCGDWHGVSNEAFLNLYERILTTWKARLRPVRKSVVVDFNQGLDSRLALNGDTLKLLAQIPVKPVRIAFDHWNLRKIYEDSIVAAAKAGCRSMSNYILYNFHDTPEELYWRLRLNVALCDELDVPIYSFPMKYHPIRDPKYFSNRDFLGEHWCRKYIRFVQLVLNSTMGKIGRGKSFFLKAFGETTEAFRELLLMPEYLIRDRFDCEVSGETERWRDSLYALSPTDSVKFKERLVYNDFKIMDESRESKQLRRLLSFYQTPSPAVVRISEEKRMSLVAEFDEKWRNASARLSEEDIAQAIETGRSWSYTI